VCVCTRASARVCRGVVGGRNQNLQVEPLEDHVVQPRRVREAHTFQHKVTLHRRRPRAARRPGIDDGLAAEDLLDAAGRGPAAVEGDDGGGNLQLPTGVIRATEPLDHTLVLRDSTTECIAEELWRHGSRGSSRPRSTRPLAVGPRVPVKKLGH
jgi:hypothetical protein